MTATAVDQTVIQNSVRALSGGAVHTALLEKQNLLGYTPENTANKNTPLGYVGLEADLKINPIYLPALPLVDVRPVASEAAMLALPSVGGTESMIEWYGCEHSPPISNLYSCGISMGVSTSSAACKSVTSSIIFLNSPPIHS